MLLVAMPFVPSSVLVPSSKDCTTIPGLGRIPGPTSLAAGTQPLATVSGCT